MKKEVKKRIENYITSHPEMKKDLKEGAARIGLLYGCAEECKIQLEDLMYYLRYQRKVTEKVYE